MNSKVSIKKLFCNWNRHFFIEAGQKIWRLKSIFNLLFLMNKLLKWSFFFVEGPFYESTTDQKHRFAGQNFNLKDLNFGYSYNNYWWKQFWSYCWWLLFLLSILRPVTTSLQIMSIIWHHSVIKKLHVELPVATALGPMLLILRDSVADLLSTARRMENLSTWKLLTTDPIVIWRENLENPSSMLVTQLAVCSLAPTPVGGATDSLSLARRWLQLPTMDNCLLANALGIWKTRNSPTVTWKKLKESTLSKISNNGWKPLKLAKNCFKNETLISIHIE